MAKSKAALETELRNDVLETIRVALAEHYDTDVWDVSTSEITIPLIDSERNEKYALVKVSIPRGTRVNGAYREYDGEAAAREYAEEVARKAAEKRAKEEAKAREEAEKERKRAARQTVKTMKKDVKEVLPNATGTASNDSDE